MDNIKKQLYNINYLFQYFWHIYFTNGPYILYKTANVFSNFAYSGIGLQLIYSQNIFWISNGIIVLNIYLYSQINNYMYINWLLFGLCIFLYIRSIQMILYIIKLIDHIKTQNHIQS